MYKYDLNFNKDTIKTEMRRLINQTWKLLPLREENNDWEKPLSTIIEELAGMSKILFDQELLFFPLICKLEGLFILVKQEDFNLYRKTIFECLTLMNDIIKIICQQ